MKLTITSRFVALSTLVVAVIFLLFNTFVYLEFMNVTIQNEKQVVYANMEDLVRRIAPGSVAQAVQDVHHIVPDPRQTVRLLRANGSVLTGSDTAPLPAWVPGGRGNRTDLGHGIVLFQHDNQRILLASAFVHLKDGAVTVQWIENVASLDHSIAFVFYLLLTGSIGGLLLAAVASYFLARYSLQPIREMIATARAISPGDLTSRIDVPKRQDELTELGHTFNDMLDRIFHGFRRERQFIADASHELRTPLSVLEGYVHLLRRWGWEDDEIRQEAVGAIEEEIRHLRAMATQLLTLAAMEQAQDAPESLVSISDVSARVIRKWQRLYPEYEWQVALAPVAQTYAPISEVRVEQVLRALLDNARKYTPAGGVITLSVIRRGQQLHLIVEDNGPGIPAEDLPYVTERFYRADKSRGRQEGGVGLGLAICREIVEGAHGVLQVRSQSAGGVQVEVVWPAGRGLENG
ncbi:MAG: HAMP domain-containing sensor histidine kinase [Firmicutes bacterium]|nr:HAMP domain-containing sensor histidine kinase [Bacillota bacterium]